MNQQPVHAVFVADDDEDDCYLLQRAFDRYSPESQMVFAPDGRALLDTLNQSDTEPCLIILDLNMPRLNGFETLTMLRSDKRYRDTPVVVMTTSSEHSDQQKAIALGADDFIIKPFSAEQLGKAVSQLRVDWHLSDCN